jgi:hypothetical protein
LKLPGRALTAAVLEAVSVIHKFRPKQTSILKFHA